MIVQKQNRSHAVMAQRVEARKSFDNFPTPPWATRALLEHVLNDHNLSEQSCLEPACGAGHMAKVQEEYFAEVESSDIFGYGFGNKLDFCSGSYGKESFDWVITNPPFKLAENFAIEGLKVARRGVALLTRTVFIESVGRFNRLFSQTPPSIMAQFVERVPMVKGRLDASASTATGYAWLIWDKRSQNTSALKWIKPCRRDLERPGDYEEIISSSYSIT